MDEISFIPGRTVDKNGNVFWLDEYGACHNASGPAIETHNGNRAWCVHGKHHREDGPSIEWANGRREWHIHGVKYTKEEHRIYQLTKQLAGI